MGISISKNTFEIVNTLKNQLNSKMIKINQIPDSILKIIKNGLNFIIFQIIKILIYFQLKLNYIIMNHL